MRITVIIVVLGGIFWLVDELIKAPLYKEGVDGEFPTWERSRYAGIFDYLKQKIRRK